MKPRFKAQWRLHGRIEYGLPTEMEQIAESDAREAVSAGATFAAILRDSQGCDHPENAGKFFLHRYVKA